MPSSGVQTCALRSEEHTSELQSHDNLVCRLLLENKCSLAFEKIFRPGIGHKRSIAFGLQSPLSKSPTKVSSSGRSLFFFKILGAPPTQTPSPNRASSA